MVVCVCMCVGGGGGRGGGFYIAFRTVRGTTFANTSAGGLHSNFTTDHTRHFISPKGRAPQELIAVPSVTSQ